MKVTLNQKVPQLVPFADLNAGETFIFDHSPSSVCIKTSSGGYTSLVTGFNMSGMVANLVRRVKGEFIGEVE